LEEYPTMGWPIVLWISMLLPLVAVPPPAATTLQEMAVLLMAATTLTIIRQAVRAMRRESLKKRGFISNSSNH
jgi:hypothetical protein